MRNRIGLLIALLLFVSACAGGEDVSTTTTGLTSTLPTATTSTVATTTTTEAGSTTTTMGATTTTTQPIDVYWEGGQVVGPESFSFSVGDQVSIWVLSDTDEEIHVHGFDVSFNPKAGIPLEISLTADAPGIFEVELEATHTPLFELEVTS